MSKAKKKDEGLTAEDLKMKMYQSLQSAGVLNNLKGYLRQSVINELRGKHDRSQPLQESDLLAATISRREDSSWNQKAIDNLILNHLRQSRYQYSLSLFQQEAGINEYNEALTDELLHRLGASPDLLRHHDDGRDKENDRSLNFSLPNTTSTPVAGGNSRLLFWQILSKISSAQNLVKKLDPEDLMEKTVERPRPMSLADKLQAIDEQMDGTLRDHRLGDIEHRKSVATLANATRRAEEAAEKRARESLEQWKKVELVSMRVKEAEKYREKMSEKNKLLEDDFAQRKEALLQREQNAIERLNHQKETMEKDLHQQRQLLLQELEQIRVRDRNLHDREQMLSDIEAVKLKELDLLKSEALSSQRHLQEKTHPVLEKSRRDSAVSSCAESLRKSLTGKESRQLDEVLRELDSRSHEAEVLRRELESVKTEMIQTKRRLEMITEHKVPVVTPRPEPSPREQEQSLRRRLDDLAKQLNEWRQTDREEREATIQSEIGRWRNEVTKLSEARDLLDDKQRRLEEMTLRLNTKLNSGPDRGSPRKQSSAATLRLLMDPEGDLEKRSIRDYDSVYTGRVRWDDRMPYSLHPGLTGKAEGPRLPSRNFHEKSDTDLNDTSESTLSSRDLSTSGIRNNFQQKFQELEKESETLEQMYKRYMQTNYKHTASGMPGTSSFAPSSPRTIPEYKQKRQPTNIPERPTSSRTKPESTTPYTPSYERSPTLTRPSEKSIPPLPEHAQKTSKQHEGTGNTRAPRRANLKDEIPLGPSQLMDRQPGLFHVTKPKETHLELEAGAADITQVLEPPRAPAPTPSPLKLDDLSLDKVGAQDFASQQPLSVTSRSRSSDKLSEPSPRPTPTKRLGALPPLSSTTPLPQITPRKSKESSVTSSVSELLVAPTPEEKKMGVQLHGGPVTPLEDPILDEVEESISESISSHTDSHPIQLSSLGPGAKDGAPSPTSPKSPFERPALLDAKREELLRSLDQPEPESPERGSDLPGSPKRDTKPSFHNDDGLQNILDSIDMSSARSLEGEADPKLTDLLNRLEPNPVVMSHKGAEQLQVEDQQGVKGGQEEDLDSEQDSREEKLSSERSGDDDYSDKFLSSTASKTTSSEIKTMSDFEPSSTSIPRIEDKVAGSQRTDDEEKSGADLNWSNLQPDRSGELVPVDVMEPPTAYQEGTMDRGRDVFEDDQSLHSFEAASDIDKKSQSSDADFW